jgi:hypothetical protein
MESLQERQMFQGGAAKLNPSSLKTSTASRLSQAYGEQFHLPRTLDEAFYPGLPLEGIAERDQGQVLTKYKRKLPRAESASLDDTFILSHALTNVPSVGLGITQRLDRLSEETNFQTLGHETRFKMADRTIFSDGKQKEDQIQPILTVPQL